MRKSRQKFVIKNVGDQKFKIPESDIRTIIRPFSRIALRYVEVTGKKVYIDGGEECMDDAAAHVLLPAFVDYCQKQKVAISIEASTIHATYRFLVDQGYQPTIENEKQLLLRAIGDYGKKLTVRIEDGKKVCKGGIPEIWQELGMKLSPLFLQSFGVERFRDKCSRSEWTMDDTVKVMNFLIDHNVQPTQTNCDLLSKGMLLELLISEEDSTF